MKSSVDAEDISPDKNHVGNKNGKTGAVAAVRGVIREEYFQDNQCRP